MARIAVVDDDRVLGRLLGHGLSARGAHEVRVFHDPAEALLAIMEGEFDLVLSDVVMPNLSGLDLCVAVRSIQYHKRPVVVLTSANGREEDIVRGLNAGAVDYLVKPFSMGMLRGKLSHFLNKPRSIAKLPTEVLNFPAARAQPPRYVGDYALLRQIGEGGFSKVYTARRSTDGKLVAVKLLLQAALDDREALGRHFREVAILSLVKSPYLVKILDSGTWDGWPYLVMDLLEGDNLDQVLERTGPLSVAETLSVGADVAKALACLHARGLVHRDVKPGNIISCGERNVLIDVGASKGVRDHSLTEPNNLVGTLGMIAPEVIRGQSDAAPSDLYSLGATLYDLLAGQPPFSGPPVETLKKVARGALAPCVSTHRPATPAALAKLDR